MRLLTRGEVGEFCLTEFHGDDIPRYAILPHTWGADNEEVTLRDLVEGTGKTKAGYKKLSFCGEQAAVDDLDYFWIDTCCIDKSSSAELSEAINSMFRWYHDASKCYVYLSDVSSSTFDLSFQNSRWFTRGWTLQELIAPACVEFYTSEGELLGDKNSLVQEIAAITGIHDQAIQGRPLSQFGIEERISWAARRETKRPEDWAYSLLGLFDIHMPLLYGEGRNKAFLRLRKEIKESLTTEEPISSLVPRVGTASGERHPQLNSFNHLQAIAHESETANAQQRILDSLRFPQHQERRQQIDQAQRETYQWILRPTPDSTQHWDSLTAWLASSTESRRIYWINGKPGAGKSTIMRFLDQNIILPDHLLPWAEHQPVLSAQYFFWNPGEKLQKSLTGLLRTLLSQLLEQRPESIPQVVQQGKWNAARFSGNHPIDWTDSELRHTLHCFTASVRRSAKIFLLVDGLDELDGSDNAREEVINLLFNMASFENVKICLSSRPWNIFRDAFNEFPQLKLEDLTRNDISKYVIAQLRSHVRFQHLYQIDPMNAQVFISGIINKATGVFLWVRLVVRELLRGLRDGDGIRALHTRLDQIPSDLNHYFRRVLDSIDFQERKEASALLQIVLYKESRFATGHPLRLIDLSFIDEGRPEFALTGQYGFGRPDFSDPASLSFFLDSSFRRLNSCCMGLLECRKRDSQIEEDSYDVTATVQDEQHLRMSPHIVAIQGQSLIHSADVPNSESSERQRGGKTLRAFSFIVDYLHRSCQDFLLTPDIQHLLHEYTDGPYNAQMFLLNSRLSQFMALATAGIGARHAVAILSYILSVLSLPEYKDTPLCETVGAMIQPVLEEIMQHHRFPLTYWYIDPSIASWPDECSSFLTLAIDFGLVSYVKAHLTSEYVRTKRGRPVLDHILRPRFAFDSYMSAGNREPNLELLETVLRLGGDPNEMYGPLSVWVRFLCFIIDKGLVSDDGGILLYSSAAEMLLRHGATPLLPKSWLSHNTDYSYFFSYDAYDDVGPEPDWGPVELFAFRWGTVTPVVPGDGGQDGSSEPLYAVNDLLEEFRSPLGSELLD
jgi:hypothetical protein